MFTATINITIYIMKKRNLKSLSLNKKSISNFDHKELTGGTFNTHINVCRSALVKPHCLIENTFPTICDCPTNMC